MSVSIVYVTMTTAKEAQRVARTVVGERLAASGNVLSQVASVYWWNNELQETREAALILKTRETLVQALVDRIQELHSYSCPGILAWQVATGNSHYLNWIAEQTEATPSEPESGDDCLE
jgi:periplasmic divalent cation tolerance protein